MKEGEQDEEVEATQDDGENEKGNRINEKVPQKWRRRRRQKQKQANSRVAGRLADPKFQSDSLFPPFVSFNTTC